MTSSISNKRKILIIYNALYTYIGTVMTYAKCFADYSKNDVFYLAQHQLDNQAIDLSIFDAVIITYSVRLCFDIEALMLPPSFRQKMIAYQGLKAVFIQDEYDNTNAAIKNFVDLEVNLVFTCVPQKNIEAIYPKAKVGNIKFVSVLTGYVDEQACQSITVKPTARRKTKIFYRGRNLPFKYGRLGQEKSQISILINDYCKRKKISGIDVCFKDSSRIYGKAWLQHLAAAKATLGTESGANIFDVDGTLATTVDEAVRKNPTLTFEEAERLYFAGQEQPGLMNQISPKLFEAICLKTALILFKGEYSGVLTPGIHFIVLEKDLSNLEQVFEKLNDDQFLQQMADRTYNDIVASGRYSYASFIQQVDTHLQQGFSSTPANGTVNNPKLYTRLPINFYDLSIFDSIYVFSTRLGLFAAKHKWFDCILRFIYKNRFIKDTLKFVYATSLKPFLSRG